VAIVTGAGSGIGRAAALRLAAEGARVALVGRRRGPLEEAAAEIAQSGGEALVLPADVADPGAVERMVGEVLRRWGRIDLLVNNAGINRPKRWYSTTTNEDWQQVININLSGVFYCIRAVLPHMRQRGTGTLIHISSLAGKCPSLAAGVAYSAAKHGLAALSATVNQEVRGTLIRSCCISPGEVDTPNLDFRPVVPPPEWRREMLQAEDIAEAILYVAAAPPRVCVEELVIRPTRQRERLPAEEGRPAGTES